MAVAGRLVGKYIPDYSDGSAQDRTLLIGTKFRYSGHIYVTEKFYRGGCNDCGFQPICIKHPMPKIPKCDGVIYRKLD